jgi:hypothetical protein
MITLFSTYWKLPTFSAVNMGICFFLAATFDLRHHHHHPVGSKTHNLKLIVFSVDPTATKV